MPRILGPDGRVVPAGRVSRTLTESFINASALPSWLSEGGTGTGTFSAVGSTWGYYQLATPATANAEAYVRTSFDIDSSKFHEVSLTLEGLHWSASSGMQREVMLDDIAHTKGIRMIETSGSGLVAATAWPVTSLGDIPLDFITPATQRMNLTMMLRPQTKEFFVLRDDQEVAWVDVSASLTNGTVRPGVRVGNSGTAASNWVRFSQIKLTLVHN